MKNNNEKQNGAGAPANKQNVKDQARALEASEKITNEQGALPASACYATWERFAKEYPWFVSEAIVVNADIEVIEYILEGGKGFPSEITQIQLCREIQKLVAAMEDPQKSKNPELLEHKASALKELLDSMGHPSCIVTPE